VLCCILVAVPQLDILNAIVEVSKDKSWRVRWSLAHRVQEVFAGLKANGAALPESAQGSLTTMYNSLLNDAEPEVKGAAASHLSAVCAHLKRSALVEVVVPSAQRLSVDSSDFVRSFFATEVNLLAPLLGKEDTLTHVIPLLHALLKDNNSEVIAVITPSLCPPPTIVFASL
jgi:serine/threonine-protein phosphatase 2A regulatory subunit A